MDGKEMTVGIVAALVAGLVLLSPVACVMREKNLIAQAIKHGAEPIAARCAIAGDLHTSACIAKIVNAPK